MAGRDRTIENLIERLNRLPGVGPKTAERLAFHLLRVEQQEAMELAQAIEEVRKAVKNCSVCFQLDASDPCSVCSDDTRERDMLLVVEAYLVVPGDAGKYYFNRALVPAMCWMLDELVQVLRARSFGDHGQCLAPTFEYIERGSRREAYANLVALAERVGEQFPELDSVIAYITGSPPTTRVPDVSRLF